MPGEWELANRFRHFYRHAITSLVEYRFDFYRSLVTKIFWNVADDDYVVQSDFIWKPWDGWTWSVGADLVGGPPDSFFGIYEGNDRARTALTFDWNVWKRRPPRPLEPVPLPALELQTTAWVEGEWLAIINGRLVRNEDTVEGATVMRIDDGVIELEVDGRRFALAF